MSTYSNGNSFASQESSGREALLWRWLQRITERTA
jgi:hypothetical protein